MFLSSSFPFWFYPFITMWPSYGSSEFIHDVVALLILGWRKQPNCFVKFGLCKLIFKRSLKRLHFRLFQRRNNFRMLGCRHGLRLKPVSAEAFIFLAQ